MHKFIVRPIFYLLLGLGFCNTLPISANRVIAQENSRPNGIFDERKNSFAFVNATVYQHGEGYLENITLLISDGVIVQLGRNVSVPDGYRPVDLSGKPLYPGFIDSYSY